MKSVHRYLQGVRPIGRGDSAGLPAGQCTPHFLFGLAERKRACTSKRKGRLDALRCSGPPRATGVGVSVPAPIWPCFGHARPFCNSLDCVPWWMVRKLPGCKDAFELLRFSCLALRRSGDFRHQCSTGSSFRAFRFATRWPGGGRQRRLSEAQRLCVRIFLGGPRWLRPRDAFW